MEGIKTALVGGWKVFYRDPLAFQHVLEQGENYESHIVGELRRHLPSSKSFLDIGCNVGVHVAIAKWINGPAFPVTAIDTRPENIDLLRSTSIENGWTNTYTAAIAAGTHTAWVFGNHLWNSAVSSDGVYGNTPQLAMRLDELPIKEAAVIKIDIEGSELHALDGMARMIDGWRPRVIFEFCPRMLKLNGSLPQDLLNYFLERRYRLTVLDYKPGMRAEFRDAAACMDHVAKFTEICDIMAEPD